MKADDDDDREFTGWVSRLAREHSQALAAAARHEGLSTDEALDAVQEAFGTFLRLPAARALVGEHTQARALLLTSVRFVARNLRRRHHRARVHLPIAEHEPVDATPSVDAVIAAAEAQATVAGCVAQLGDLHRQVVTLRMLEELSGDEVAARLELTPGYVAVLLHRAKKQLYDCVVASGL
jgi:RNA polymerase sigma-70 factor (ECF subfamily)